VLRSLLRPVFLLALFGLLAVSCGDDDADSSTGDDLEVDESTADDDDATSPESTDTDETDTDDTTTTTTVDEVPESTTTTAAASNGPSGVLAEGSVTTSDGFTSNWKLTATGSSLCFEADLSHPDPETEAGAGDGVAACLEPDGGLDAMESGLSVDVGTVDGEKTIGFLWGRVAPEVIVLTIEHADGTQTPIDILEGPTDVQVFAYVVEVDTIPPVQDLDAVSGTQLEGSAAIRDFLRSGPTYPVSEAPPTPPAPDYPVS